MILYIDSTDFNAVTYALAPEGSKGKVIKKIYKIDPHESHKTLGKLEEFLKFVKAKPSDIKKIIVNKGPGSYTGTRVGVTHALALGFAWGVKVEALEKTKFANVFA